MTTLYFMRHAQSEANLADILASQLDFPLTEQGHQDALGIAEEFQQQHQLSKLIVSPLSRAQQTAAPFAQLFDLTIADEPRVTEQALGKYAGKTYAELNDEPNYCHDRSQRWNWVPEEGGESYAMIVDRLMPFFAALLVDGDESILVITHAVTMRMIKAILTDILPEYPHEIAHNGEVWQVEFKGLGQQHQIKSLFFGNSKAQDSRA